VTIELSFLLFSFQIKDLAFTSLVRHFFLPSSKQSTFFIRIYLLYGGGVHCHNSKWTYIVLWLYHLHPLPAPCKAIARGLFVVFHVSICSPSTLFPPLNPLHSPPTNTSHTHTLHLFYSPVFYY
jgi:hypothetical protein